MCFQLFIINIQIDKLTSKRKWVSPSIIVHVCVHDAPPNSLKGSNASPKVKIAEEGIGALVMTFFILHIKIL